MNYIYYCRIIFIITEHVLLDWSINLTYVNSVLKSFQIMNLFDENSTRLSLAEISKRLEMPKSTVHNLLKTLLSVGYIERTENELYALGVGLLSITQNIRVNIEIRDPASPLLRDLADQTRQSVYLTVRDGDYALYIYAIESPKRLLARTAIGERIPLHCTSVGKAILAYLPVEEVKKILSHAGMQKFTSNTITTPPNLLKELQEIKKLGYSTDNQEHEFGTFCVGAPIFDRTGKVIASCSVSGSDNDIIQDKNFTMKLTHYSQEISRRMGFVPSRNNSFA